MREFDISDTIMAVIENSKAITMPFFLQQQSIQDTHTAISKSNSYNKKKNTIISRLLLYLYNQFGSNGNSYLFS